MRAHAPQQLRAAVLLAALAGTVCAAAAGGNGGTAAAALRRQAASAAAARTGGSSGVGRGGTALARGREHPFQTRLHRCAPARPPVRAVPVRAHRPMRLGSHREACSWMAGLGTRLSLGGGVQPLPRPNADLRSGPVLSFVSKDEEEDDWDG